MVYNSHVHQLTVYLYVRAGALTSHDLYQNWWLWKELLVQLLYLLCADIELEVASLLEINIVDKRVGAF